MSNQRHFAKLRGEEVVVIGYKRSMNACMICRLNSLPQDESMQLRRIASSVNSQEKDYLVQTLQVEQHKSGQDWFTYLVARLHRGDGSVSSIPLKELEDMHQGQKAFFKGYGKSVTEAEKKTPEEESGIENGVPQAYISDEEKKEKQRAAAMAVDPGQQAMMQLMQQMVEGQIQLTETLNSLSEKLDDDKSIKPAKKATTRRRAPSKKTSSKKEETSQEASA